MDDKLFGDLMSAVQEMVEIEQDRAVAAVSLPDTKAKATDGFLL
ncbi:hypothetical protein [Neisseria animalis]|nr:hypothetical protein [Neisseria animalis]VEE07263.1 Uncharacterised protein [Neisseria animalis]